MARSFGRVAGAAGRGARRLGRGTVDLPADGIPKPPLESDGDGPTASLTFPRRSAIVNNGYRLVGIAVAVGFIAGCGGDTSSDKLVITLPLTQECSDLSERYYDAVGDRMVSDWPTAAYKEASAREDRLEAEMREKGCWP